MRQLNGLYILTCSMFICSCLAREKQTFEIKEIVHDEYGIPTIDVNQIDYNPPPETIPEETKGAESDQEEKNRLDDYYTFFNCPRNSADELDCSAEKKYTIDKILNILNIDSLELLKNLVKNQKVLSLKDSNIVDISPLRVFKNLAYLYLQDNEIVDIGPIQDLTHLKLLQLGGNRIQEITPVKHLNQLRKLYLWNNKITDLRPLQDLAQSEKGSRLSLLHLANIDHLKSSFAKAQNNITSLKPLRSLSSLLHLDLSNNRSLKNLDGIQSLQSLKFLNLSQTQSQLTSLKGLPELRALLLHNSKIDASNAKNLGRIPNLKCLDLSSNSINEILFCGKGSSAYEKMDLSDNKLVAISELERKSSLKWLDISLNSKLNQYQQKAILNRLSHLSGENFFTGNKEDHDKILKCTSYRPLIYLGIPVIKVRK